MTESDISALRLAIALQLLVPIITSVNMQTSGNILYGYLYERVMQSAVQFILVVHIS